MSAPLPIARTLSHSAMEEWTQCPRRWYLHRIAKVPRAPSEHLIFGDAIHQALQADGDELVAGRKPLPLPMLISIFSRTLGLRLAEDDPSGLLGEEKMLELRLRGLAILRAYVEQIQPHYQPTSAEGNVRFPISGLEGWEFTGYIDAVTSRNDICTIVDWKTASKLWPQGAEHDKDQATAYLWAQREMQVKTPAERVTFIVFSTLRDHEGYSCIPEYRTTMRQNWQLDSYAQKVRETACDIVAALEGYTTVDGNRPAPPATNFSAKISPLCGWCACLGACADGKSYLRMRNRTPAVPLLQVEEVVQ